MAQKDKCVEVEVGKRKKKKNKVLVTALFNGTDKTFHVFKSHAGQGNKQGEDGTGGGGGGGGGKKKNKTLLMKWVGQVGPRHQNSSLWINKLTLACSSFRHNRHATFFSWEEGFQRGSILYRELGMPGRYRRRRSLHT